MSYLAAPTTQSYQTVPTTQAAPVMQAVNYGNPFTWELSEVVKVSIEDVVYREVFMGSKVKRQDMGSLVSYRIAPLVFDTQLKAHLVHPAFWTFDTYRAPKITIKEARGTYETWCHCFNVLYREVLKKYRLHDAVVGFLSDNPGEEIYGPRYIHMNGISIMNNEDPEIPTCELLSAKLQMLQDQSPYARSEEEKSWFEHALMRVSELVKNRTAKAKK